MRQVCLPDTTPLGRLDEFGACRAMQVCPLALIDQTAAAIYRGIASARNGMGGFSYWPGWSAAAAVDEPEWYVQAVHEVIAEEGRLQRKKAKEGKAANK